MARPADRRTPTTVEFGRRMRELRKAAGLSQEALAHSVGLSWTYVASIERGERNLGLANIIRLAVALGVEPGTMVNDLPGAPPHYSVTVGLRD